MGDRHRSRSPRRSRSRSRSRVEERRRRSPEPSSRSSRRSRSRSRGRRGSDRGIQQDRNRGRDQRSRSRDRGERQHHHASAPSGQNAGRFTELVVRQQRGITAQWSNLWLIWFTGGWPQSRRPMSHNSEPPVSDQPPPVGSIHQGAVHTVKHFGIFVSIPGYRRHVLVHHTQVGTRPECVALFWRGQA